MGEEVFVLTIVTFSVLATAGVIVVVMGMWQGMKTQEMAHRERMAMIEKGLAPSPERDPAAFDRWRRPARPRTRATTMGVAIAALGLALMLLIGVAGDALDVGIGVGGAITVLGLAFVVIGELQRRTLSSGDPAAGYGGPPPIDRA